MKSSIMMRAHWPKALMDYVIQHDDALELNPGPAGMVDYVIKHHDEGTWATWCRVDTMIASRFSKAQYRN
jgi:hypothetical protein